jgi:hypothetical protein
MSTLTAGNVTVSCSLSADTSGNLVFQSGGNVTAMTIDSSQNVGIGTSSPSERLQVAGSIRVTSNANDFNVLGGQFDFATNATRISAYNSTGGVVQFFTNPSSGTVLERARIDSSGVFMVGTTNTDPAGSGTNANGIAISADSYISMTRTSAAPLNVNRKSTDGDVVTIRQDGTTEGTISVSGTTVSYNAFAGSHWSQLQDGSKPNILRGTVMESINELCVWLGESNERLPKAKISDTAGSKKVYGVFMAWDNDWTETNDMYVTAVGAFICRVNSSVTVQEGDLLESNGDGTARVQADDIIRSSTIGKVTSTIKTHQYDDGSYCVPTVLYCG